MRTWARDGLPPNPGGWITTTARNRAIDHLRREARGQELISEVAVLTPESDDLSQPEETRPVQDDRLSLIFTCCHPALSTDAQVALTLRLLGGPSSESAWMFSSYARRPRTSFSSEAVTSSRTTWRMLSPTMPSAAEK